MLHCDEYQGEVCSGVPTGQLEPSPFFQLVCETLSVIGPLNSTPTGILCRLASTNRCLTVGPFETLKTGVQ